MTRVEQSHGITEQQGGEIRDSLARISTIGKELWNKRNQQVYRFQVGGLDLIAKCYSIKTVKRRTSAALGFSRARRSFRASRTLAEAGIPTPEAIYLLEDGPLFSERTAIYVTRYFDGLSLRNLVETDSPIPTSLPRQIRKVFDLLQTAKLRHGDLHAANILVSSQGDLSIIDLDSVRYRRSRKTLTKNLQHDRDRLLRSIQHPQFKELLALQIGDIGTPLPE